MDEVKEKTPQEYAQDALKAIREHPEAFNMSTWFTVARFDDVNGFDVPAETTNLCGTTMCVAGWVAHNAGYKLADYGVDEGGEPRYNLAVKPGQLSENIETLARRLLGLEQYFAATLFTATELRAIEALEFLAAGERPEYQDGIYDFIERCEAKRDPAEVMGAIADWADRQVPGE